MNPHPADPTTEQAEPQPAPVLPLTRYRLTAKSGPCEGQYLEVRSEKFFIGSDPGCQLRPAVPGLAGIHAEIDHVEGLMLFIRDMDTELGTTVNGVTLHNKRRELFDGDEIRIGPLALTVLVGAHWDRPGLSEAPEGWPLTTPCPTAPTAKEDAPRPAEYPVGEQKGAKGSLTYEVVGDVLKVTLLSPEYNDEDTVSPMRVDFHDLLEHNLPRKVVVDMSAVTYVSSRAVGVLLAHFQGLGRVDGAMRICGIHPDRVLPVFKQMKLQMFIDTYDTVEEALQDPWE